MIMDEKVVKMKKTAARLKTKVVRLIEENRRLGKKAEMFEKKSDNLAAELQMHKDANAVGIIQIIKKLVAETPKKTINAHANLLFNIAVAIEMFEVKSATIANAAAERKLI